MSTRKSHKLMWRRREREINGIRVMAHNFGRLVAYPMAPCVPPALIHCTVVYCSVCLLYLFVSKTKHTRRCLTNSHNRGRKSTSDTKVVPVLFINYTLDRINLTLI